MLSVIVAASVGTMLSTYLTKFVTANRLEKTFGYFLFAVSVLMQNRQQRRLPQLENHWHTRLIYSQTPLTLKLNPRKICRTLPLYN
ncbi:hypothetical protein H6G35_17085 [Aulosira sp. FACHB-113]|uniref:hypothetical protein n=1 Tax=Tolypothrix tenuis TaxID=457083 RepID=UPI00168411CD|nr:hypothetical protein [Aulosira sp. FACHB-113]